MAEEAFEFPKEWHHKIKCNVEAFVADRAAEGSKSSHGKRKTWSCRSCCATTALGDNVCKCHSLCSHCAYVRQCQGSLRSRAGEDQPLEHEYPDIEDEWRSSGSMHWQEVIEPYLPLVVTDEKKLEVLSDCTRKINQSDPHNGFGVLHGLLVSGDDDSLMRDLLRLGANPENRFHGEKSHGFEHYPDLDGGTALHFAVFFERKDCLKALIQAGADLFAKTKAGKDPVDLTADQVIKETLGKAKEHPETGPLAHLAKKDKYFAIWHRMRTGKLQIDDLALPYHGKTATEWLRHAMEKHWGYSFQLTDEFLAPFRVMAELKYRYAKDLLDYIYRPEMTDDKHKASTAWRALMAMDLNLDDIAGKLRGMPEDIQKMLRNYGYSFYFRKSRRDSV